MREGSFITVTGKGNKDRVVPMNDRARDAVRAWAKTLPKETSWLFPASGDSGHLARQVFARDLKALAGRAGAVGMCFAGDDDGSFRIAGSEMAAHARRF